MAVKDRNRVDYERRSMPPFHPYHDRPQVSMSYCEVPADVLEDADECAEWALRAVAAGIARASSLQRRVRDGSGLKGAGRRRDSGRS